MKAVRKPRKRFKGILSADEEKSALTIKAPTTTANPIMVQFIGRISLRNPVAFFIPRFDTTIIGEEWTYLRGGHRYQLLNCRITPKAFVLSSRSIP